MWIFGHRRYHLHTRTRKLGFMCLCVYVISGDTLRIKNINTFSSFWVNVLMQFRETPNHTRTFLYLTSMPFQAKLVRSSYYGLGCLYSTWPLRYNKHPVTDCVGIFGKPNIWFFSKTEYFPNIRYLHRIYILSVYIWHSHCMR